MAAAAVYPRGVATLAAVVGVLLRVIVPERPAPNPDELFTGVYAQGPLGELTGRLLARGDTHPPLDYVLRHPFVGGGSVTGLRLVSVVSAAGLVLVVWWWLRDRGWLGAGAVVLTALSPFLVFYGRMARPYSPLMLAATVVAVAAERWLAAPAGADARGGRRWAVVAAVALLVGLLLESSMALLVPGGLLVAGRRRDRAAWEWRTAVAAGVGAWVVVWAWRVPGQYTGGGASWIPLVGPGDAVVITGSLVAALHPTVAVFAAGALALGLRVLFDVDRSLALLVAGLAAVPLALGLVASSVLHIGLARSFAALAWAPPIVLAGLVVGAARRGPWVGGAAAALVAVLVMPSLAAAYTFDDDTGRAAAEVARRARPGDLAAISPAPLDHVLRWTFGQPVVAAPAGVEGASVVVVAGGSPPVGGRLWVIDVQGIQARVEGRRPCPESVPDQGGDGIRCFGPPEVVTPPR